MDKGMAIIPWSLSLKVNVAQKTFLLMKKKPIISVIIPVYNTEKYLRRCIDSVLAQTYQDFELLLIDDGRKDSSGDICDE